MEYVEKHYPEKCWVGVYSATCRTLPLKISAASPLSNLTTYRHTSQIKYLAVPSKFNAPNAGGWDDYKNALALCPNLKGICIVEMRGGQRNNLLSSEHITSENKQMWNDRIAYLNSLNIEVMTEQQFCQQFKNYTKKPVFTF
jgi:hypothetical protein